MEISRQILTDISRRKLLRDSFLILLLTLAFWLPRGFSLDRFVSTDEIAWLVRSANFYYALGQRDFENTFQKYHPGVTTMWVNTFAFLIEYPEYRGWGQGQFESFLEFERFADSKNIDTHGVLITGRSIMVIIHTSLLILGFFMARRLFGFLPALIGFLLLSFEPFTIGLTRLSHLDGLIGTLSILSVLALLVYAFEDQKLIFLIISAVGASLASLTKITGFIVLPGLGFIFLFMIIRYRKSHLDDQEQDNKDWLRRTIQHIFTFAVTYLLVYFILWPAMWVDPIERIIDQIIEPWNFLPDVDGLVASSVKEPSTLPSQRPIDWFRIPRVYQWRASPVHLGGLISLIYFLMTRKHIFAKPKIRNVTLSLIVFVVIFTIFLTIPAKHNFRYWIPAFMILSFLSGIGWFSLISTISDLVPKYKKVVFSLMVLGVFLMQIIAIFQTYPYYVSYYNPLLGGGKKVVTVFPVGEGEGLDQAGRYLSTLPNAEHLTVMSWYGWGSFSYYFTGKTIIFPVTGSWTNGLIEKLEKSDYLVTYSSQWRRGLPAALIRQLRKTQPLKTIWIDGIEYARIYKVSDLPPVLFSP
jgi:4-amino-4-deoxy-L-arabinose transferase-like glycosyltransferase